MQTVCVFFRILRALAPVGRFLRLLFFAYDQTPSSPLTSLPHPPTTDSCADPYCCSRRPVRARRTGPPLLKISSRFFGMKSATYSLRQMFYITGLLCTVPLGPSGLGGGGNTTHVASLTSSVSSRGGSSSFGRREDLLVVAQDMNIARQGKPLVAASDHDASERHRSDGCN